MSNCKIPKHVAIIMDGNGRWAKRKGLPRSAGHVQGGKVVEQILEDARDLGIRYLTVYAFSTENWSRPQDEVKALMKLLREYMRTSIKKCMKNNVRTRVIGDRTKLDKDIIEAIEKLEDATKENTGVQFTIAINYGARDEIRRAVEAIAGEVAAKELAASEVTEEVINDHLDTRELPDPDLLIRTCGEQRISNFLLWQCAYTEFYYTDKAWPDFDKAELQKALDAYADRDRRYGKV
ncbi:MAG: isoprenyl transferase [Lachnospiraceae bacterium]|nr:isoprenyl transferase [Lachnospiraceae bacterium]